MKDMYIPDGFNIITEPCESHTSYEEMLLCGDCIEQALRLNRLAHESATADLRRSEGLERPYESEDSRSHQTHQITDGLSEALLLKLSPQWLDEEAEWTDEVVARGKWARAKQSSDWEYWIENHHVQAICHICHMATSEIGCTDCNTAIAVPKGDGDCFPNICSVVENCLRHAGELPDKREERMVINSNGQFITL